MESNAMDALKNTTKQTKKLRTRTAYSCEPCRERKVKCDRCHPCKRCVKAGLEKPCIYRSKNSPRSGEVVVGTRDSAPPQLRDEAIPTFGNSAFKMNGSIEGFQHNFSLCRGKNFTTRYYSRSHEVGFMSEFVWLKDFIRKACSLHADISTLRDRLERAKEFHQARSRRATLEDVANLADAEFLSTLLPDVHEQEELILRYTTKFETIYRIIHPPGFLSLVGQSRSKPSNITSPVTAQLLLICTIASSVDADTPEEYTGESTPARDIAVRVVRLVDTWLTACRPKRPDIPVLQIHCLLIMLRKIYGIDAEQIWSFTSELVILAKTMGLHRDPSIWKKTTPYAAEIRRRLWATIIEFHIQASIERGMTPCVRHDECDCDQPANINDDELRDDMKLPPTSKPPSIFTKSSLQVLVSRSQSLRLKLVHRINGLRWDMNQKEVMDLEHQIMDYRSTFQCDSHNFTDQNQTMGNEIPVVSPYTSLFQLHLRQFDLLLLQPFTISADCQPGTFERRTCLEISSATIETSFECLNNTSMEVKYLIPYSMVVRSALYICQDIIRSSSQISEFILKQRLATISAAIEIIRARVLAVGRGLRDFALLSMSLGYVLSRTATQKPCADEEPPMIEACERVAAVCRIMLKGVARDSSTGESTDSCMSKSNITEQNGLPNFEMMSEQFPPLDMALFADWMPDAVWDFDAEGNFNDGTKSGFALGGEQLDNE